MSTEEMLDPGKDAEAGEQPHLLGRRLAGVGVRKDLQRLPCEGDGRVRAPLYLLVHEGVFPDEGAPAKEQVHRVLVRPWR